MTWMIFMTDIATGRNQHWRLENFKKCDIIYFEYSLSLGKRLFIKHFSGPNPDAHKGAEMRPIFYLLRVSAENGNAPINNR